MKYIMNSNTLKVIFSFFLLVIPIMIFLMTINFFKGQSNEMEKIFKEKDSIVENSVYSFKSNIKEIKQLKEQFEIVNKIKKPYFTTAKKYSSYHYTFSILFTLFSILTGILSFLILLKGWENVNSFYLKSAFLVSFFWVSLFGILPNVLGNNQNIKNNLGKYNFYNGLHLDIYSLINDNKGYIKRDTKYSLDSLNLEILSITKNIKENQDLYFDVFIDKVPKEIKPFQ